MDRRTTLLAIAFGFALVSAVSHLVLGAVGSMERLLSGTTDLLGPLFVLAAALVVALVVAFLRGTVAPPVIYAAGAVLMFVHLLAYADWHAVGVAESVLGLEEHGHDHGYDHDDGHGDDHSHDDDDGHSHGNEHGHDDGHAHDHSHDGPAHEVLIDHLRADAIALVTKTAEAVSMLAFVALYVLER